MAPTLEGVIMTYAAIAGNACVERPSFFRGLEIPIKAKNYIAEMHICA